MPFLKCFFPALYRKRNMERNNVRRREEGLFQEEVEMGETEEVGKDRVRRDGEEERERFYVILKNVKIILKEALANLKHFFG